MAKVDIHAKDPKDSSKTLCGHKAKPNKVRVVDNWGYVTCKDCKDIKEYSWK